MFLLLFFFFFFFCTDAFFEARNESFEHTAKLWWKQMQASTHAQTHTHIHTRANTQTHMYMVLVKKNGGAMQLLYVRENSNVDSVHTRELQRQCRPCLPDDIHMTRSNPSVYCKQNKNASKLEGTHGMINRALPRNYWRKKKGTQWKQKCPKKQQIHVCANLAASYSSKDPPSLAYWQFASNLPNWTVCVGVVGIALSAKIHVCAKSNWTATVSSGYEYHAELPRRGSVVHLGDRGNRMETWAVPVVIVQTATTRPSVDMSEMAACDGHHSHGEKMPGQSDAMGSLGSHRVGHEDQATHQHKYQSESLHLQV